MDIKFVAHRDYIENRANISCVLLRAVLQDALPRRLDTMDIVEQMPTPALHDEDGNFLVPLGDLNWAREWLAGIPEAVDPMLTPIEIPDALLPYVGREYFWARERNLDAEHMNAGKYFLKDADTLKTWNSMLYDGYVSEIIEPDTIYSVSEKVNFLSEWRVFVFEDVERGAYNYLGDAMMFPDRDRIHEMVRAYADDILRPRPRAYTLDVGIIADKHTGEHVTVPIEVHPFVACGLYGFSSPVIADMLVAGYEWYLKDAGTSLIDTD